MPETFTDTESDLINLNYQVGEMNSSVTLRPMAADEAGRLAAGKAVANLLYGGGPGTATEMIDADLQSITARQAVTPNQAREDSAAKIYPVRFNFRLIKDDDSVEQVTVFVPWGKQLNQAAKKTLGDAIATALSGTKGTYIFRS